MKTTTASIADLITKLQQLDSALGDALDVLNTPRAQAEFRGTKQTLAYFISGLRNFPNDLERARELLAAVEARRAAVVAKQAEIEQAIAAAPDWRTVHGGRERDAEYDRQQHLRRQLQLLHEGALLMAPGACFERLADLDARIDELTTKIATLRARQDAHVKAAEALLAETVSS